MRRNVPLPFYHFPATLRYQHLPVSGARILFWTRISAGQQGRRIGGQGQCFKQSTLQEDKVDVSTLICQSLRQGCEAASHLRNPGDEVAPRRATAECGKRIITIIMTKTWMTMMMTKTKTSMTIRKRGRSRGREPQPLLGCNNNAPQKLHIL